MLAADILAGRLVGIRIEPALLMFDPDTRELLRVRPLTPEQALRLRGARRHPGRVPHHQLAVRRVRAFRLRDTTA